MAVLMTIKVKTDVKRMTRDLTKVQKKIVPKITAQVLNFTVKKVKTQMVRSVASQSGVKQKILRGRIRFGSKANASKLRATISTWFMPIFALAGMGRPKGMKVPSGTPNKNFFATMPTGHQGIFSRKAKTRLKIKETTVVINPAAESAAVNIINTFAIPTFLKEFQRLLKVRLKRKG